MEMIPADLYHRRLGQLRSEMPVSINQKNNALRNNELDPARKGIGRR
jgi:hypothetical protein